LPNARLELWDVNEVLRQAAALYDGREDVTIDVRLAEDLPAAMIDDEQLKRVFVNLIDNAIEAPGDEIVTKVSVTSRLESARDLIVVEVGDNGRGIDPADYPKLFQPYFSTKGRGTGLGLAIVHRIIAEHHGKIKAVPNQPYGAKFIVELPLTA
jgi:signal transduction histidine kinase